MGMAMHQTVMGFRHDPEVRGRGFERELLRRVLGLTRPYRRALIGFLITVIAAAAIGAVQPLLFRALIDDALKNRDKHLLLLLAIGAVGIAVATAVLSLLQRWYSARVG